MKEGAAADGAARWCTHFTCLTGTKVQVLTKKALLAWWSWAWRRRTSIHLRYWYKSTITDAKGAASLVKLDVEKTHRVHMLYGGTTIMQVLFTGDT